MLNFPFRVVGREPRAQLLHEHRTRGEERLLARPHLADDLHARVLSGGLDGDHAPARRERGGERLQHEPYLEPGAVPRAEGLRRDDEVVAADRRLGRGDDRIEREPVVGAVEHDHRRLDVDRVAGARARAHLPPVGQDRAQLRDLPVELVRGVTFEGELPPVDARPGAVAGRLQPGGLAVVQVGEHHHGLRVLGESVRELLQGEPHVLQADLLADDEERHGGEVPVKLSEHARHHGTVAGPGVEHPQRGWRGRERRQLGADALADRPLLAAGGHEQQVLLPVVEEAERALVGHVGLQFIGLAREGRRGGMLPVPFAGVPMDCASAAAAEPASRGPKDRFPRRPPPVARDEP